MKAEVFILSIIGINPTYNYQISRPEVGLNVETLMDDIHNSAPNPLLENAGILYDKEGYSQTLDRAISNIANSTLCTYKTFTDLTWMGYNKPGKHYHAEIKPTLTDEEASQLEKYAKSLR